MTIKKAIIGGTGVYTLAEEAQVQFVASETVVTDYGDVNVEVMDLNGEAIVFMCRHGSGHRVPPHQINYRANIQALKKLGVESVLATNAVGGIVKGTGPGEIMLPSQIIDYTWGREHTFFDHFSEGLAHIDFTEPFSGAVLNRLRASLNSLSVSFMDDVVYGCVQGPRLETAAEVRRFERDGCDVLGMTLMPEAALARELDIDYATVCYSVNWAAGVEVDGAPAIIDWADIKKNIELSSARLKSVLLRALS